MTTTSPLDLDTVEKVIDRAQEAEQATLEAVRRFVDTVDDVIPGPGEDGPRRKVIDAAFRMSEQIVARSHDLARNMVSLAQTTLDGDADADKADVETK